MAATAARAYPPPRGRTGDPALRAGRRGAALRARDVRARAARRDDRRGRPLRGGMEVVHARRRGPGRPLPGRARRARGVGARDGADGRRDGGRDGARRPVRDPARSRLLGRRRRAVRVAALPRRRGLRGRVTISLRPRGPFSLPEPVVLALTDDGGEPVAFRAAWSEAAEAVEVDFVSDLPAVRVERHAARGLSLDVDASGMEEVAGRDPVVARLLRDAGGRRPVLFGTPFEAAVWAVLSQRVSMAQAARVRDALAADLGTPMEVGGEAVTAFPGPRALGELETFPGVWASKLERIRGLAAAALAGDLDPDRLRELDLDAAMDHLQSLPGVGPFGATLILARGAGHPDVPPPTLRRFRQAVAAAYGLAQEPDDAKLAALSEAWRPYRAWVTYLLRSAGPG